MGIQQHRTQLPLRNNQASSLLSLLSLLYNTASILNMEVLLSLSGGILIGCCNPNTQTSLWICRQGQHHATPSPRGGPGQPSRPALPTGRRRGPFQAAPTIPCYFKKRQEEGLSQRTTNQGKKLFSDDQYPLIDLSLQVFYLTLASSHLSPKSTNKCWHLVMCSAAFPRFGNFLLCRAHFAAWAAPVGC